MKTLSIFIILLFSTCKGMQEAPEGTPNNIPFQVLITSSQSNIEEPKRKIITSQKELESIFAEINKTRKPGIPIPEIDFNTEIVALATMGQVSTGGHTIAVDYIEMAKEKVIIHIRTSAPKPGENATMVITTPFTMVTLKKQILPVVFDN